MNHAIRKDGDQTEDARRKKKEIAHNKQKFSIWIHMKWNHYYIKKWSQTTSTVTNKQTNSDMLMLWIFLTFAACLDFSRFVSSAYIYMWL